MIELFFLVFFFLKFFLEQTRAKENDFHIFEYTGKKSYKTIQKNNKRFPFLLSLEKNGENLGKVHVSTI